ncbi:TetR/AcrR family transcriptional regulator [Paenibacillus sp. Marseille-Q7038]
MNSMQELSQLVRECITEALFQLMKKKEFSKIKITDIVNKAGVGRASFYRNFTSKEDVILKHLQHLADDWWKYQQVNKKSDVWQLTFSLFEVLKPTAVLLHKSNLSLLFYQFLMYVTHEKKTENKSEAYRLSMTTGLYFGIFNQWATSRMKESPEELIHIFQDFTLPI